MGQFMKTVFEKVLAKLLTLPLPYYPYKLFMHRYRCIFVHIPKNAGTSVLTVFNDTSGRKHAKWYDFYRASNGFFNHYHKFAIVREPLHRLYSSYQYAVSGGNQGDEDLAIQQSIGGQCDSFEGFVNNVLDADFIMLQLLFQPQYLYLYDRALNCRVDTVLRYENVLEEWQSMAKEYGYPTHLPWLNASDASRLPLPDLSNAAMAKVKLLYRFDYQLFQYEC
jgi:hypothetical protein